MNLVIALAGFLALLALLIPQLRERRSKQDPGLQGDNHAVPECKPNTKSASQGSTPT